MSGNTDSWGVAVLSADDVEAAAEDTLRSFDARLLAVPRSTPVLSLIEQARGAGLRLEWRDLSAAGGPGRLIGRFLFSPPTIQIDPVLERSPRAQFVLAHEFGHYILHRDLAVLQRDYVLPPIADSELEIFGAEASIAPARKWMEWQARRFAAALLVPRPTLPEAVRVALQDMRSIRRAMSPAQKREKLIKLVAEAYAVSGTLVRHRLRELDLLPS